MDNESFDTMNNIFKNAPQIKPNTASKELHFMNNIPSEHTRENIKSTKIRKKSLLQVETKAVKSNCAECSDTYSMTANLQVTEGRRVLHLPKRASPLKSALYNNLSPIRSSIAGNRTGSIFSTPSSSPHKSKLTNKLMLSNSQINYDDISPIKKKSSAVKLNSGLNNPKLTSLLSSSSPTSSPTLSTSSSSACSFASIRSEMNELSHSNKFDFDCKQKKRKIGESPISINSFQVNRSPIRQIKSSPLKNYNKQISEILNNTARFSSPKHRRSKTAEPLDKTTREKESIDARSEDAKVRYDS